GRNARNRSAAGDADAHRRPRERLRRRRRVLRPVRVPDHFAALRGVGTERPDLVPALLRTPRAPAAAGAAAGRRDLRGFLRGLRSADRLAARATGGDVAAVRQQLGRGPRQQPAAGLAGADVVVGPGGAVLPRLAAGARPAAAPPAPSGGGARTP